MKRRCYNILSGGRTGIVILLMLLCLSGVAWADPMKGPWQERNGEVPGTEVNTRTMHPGVFLVRLYQKCISPIDGSRCPMYPSCSQYGMTCFKKHGFLIGWTMIWDRLYRCGRDERRLSPTVRINGEFRHYDPVADNDFWWHRE